MSMPVTGLLIFLYLLGCLLFRPRNLLPAVIFFAPFTGTAVINLNVLSIGISPSYVSMAFFILSGLMFGSVLQQYRVSRDHLLQLGVLIGFSLVVFFCTVRSFAVQEFTISLLTQTAYVVFGVLTTIILSLELTRDGQFERALVAIRVSSLFVFFWAMVQFVCFYAHIPYPAEVFNTSVSKSADMFAQNFGAVVRLASVAVEPSVMVFSLLHFLAFGLSVVTMDPAARVKAWMVPTVVTLLLVLSSTSSTGYVGLLVLAVLLGLRRPARILVGAIPLLVICGLAILAFPQFAQAIWQFTFNKADSYSYMERMAVVQDSFDHFFQNPIFGAGWGAVTPGDLLGTILGNSGVIGLVAFAAVIASMMVSLISVERAALAGGDVRLRSYAVGAQNTVIVAICISLTSGMKYYFLDDWCYWAIAIAVSSQPRLVAAAMYRIRPEAGLQAAASTHMAVPARRYAK